MSILDHIDAATDEVESAFWSLVHSMAEGSSEREADAFFLLRRSVAERFRKIKPTSGVDFRDDGRAALWRVRLTIWRGFQEDTLLADTEPNRDLREHGDTLIAGLPGVATWARELILSAHEGHEVEGVGEASLANKIKSLRVALSTQGGECVWRLRYSVMPPKMPEGVLQPYPKSLRGVRSSRATPEPHLALVRIAREAGAPGHRR